MIDHEKVEQAVRLLLEGIGEDVNREGLIDTPDRIARMYEEIYGGMEEDAGVKMTHLKVDGGASANNMLMKFQADIAGIRAERPKCIETTALGAAYLAPHLANAIRRCTGDYSASAESCYRTSPRPLNF